MSDRAYYEDINIKNEIKLRELISNLPRYSKQFFIGIEPTTSSRTRIAYAYDLGCFFDYLHENVPRFMEMKIQDYPISLLDDITPLEVEAYLNYLKYYTKDGVTHTNDSRGIKRKLAALRSFYKYFFKKDMIDKNPTVKVSMPKIHDKNIVRLDVDEVVQLLDETESGAKLTDRQQKYHERTKVRDFAILILLLGTGIRVSECVGLDITDIDFKNNGIKIHRKGGTEVMVYFGDEVREAIDNYLEERRMIEPQEGSKDALFLSLQNRRISVRAVENLVKKYSRLVTSVKNITPHKLRSTYGTNLYRETGDIYLVADVLGHQDVNTTRRHYAAIDEDRRKMAAKFVHLRRED
ncbi:tyrosine-type recombinase/integrase [Lachnobacterium bovis]|jgi:site-specific recombinase XerD|uniref:Site-specific recombinase XerD n=1 Tax=Lachnobacterium bovis DSM 14045 TaxID=1122142 RepID=A0A1H3F580_9FIRM|nr:tyrosine-type recombinase/integrase [Lachnobacterium bovis]SDX86142.1 Site-specific recombinase XerD [Lachnobacterium bovis DSM 14045]